MISTTYLLWPHGLLALGWTLLCGYGLLRTRKTESGPVSLAATAANDSEWLWETYTSQPARDTQAGRI